MIGWRQRALHGFKDSTGYNGSLATSAAYTNFCLLAKATAWNEHLSLCTTVTMAPSGDYTDLHELAKGWKAAIVRATDPATKYVALMIPQCSI